MSLSKIGFRRLLSVALLANLSLPLYSQDEIRLAAPDNWCPVACSAEGSLQGYYIDVAKRVWPKKKIIYKNIPYSRAKQEALAGRIDAIPAALMAEVPGFILSRNPGSTVKFCAWTDLNSKWRYKKLESLVGMSVGLLDGYEYPAKLQNFLEGNVGKLNVEILKGRFVVKRLGEMVEMGRLDTFFEGKEVVEWLIKDKKLPQLRNAGCLKDVVKAYLAFSPKLSTAKQMAEEYSVGLKNLELSGQLAKIKKKYGISDKDY